MYTRSFVAASILLLASCAPPQDGGARIDPEIAAEVSRIKAIDNHAHPVRPVAPGETPDNEYDALPVETLEPQSDPVRIRPGSPELIDAHRRIFSGDKPRAVKTYGLDYANRVLDQLNIETMLANRVAMGPGMMPPRFLWVPYLDALMYPLPTDSIARTPDQKAFFALEDRVFKRYLTDSGFTSKPATLDVYLDKVVRATIERQKAGGAVAEKFEMAYLRTFEIGNPPKADADKVYATGAGDYKILQDYIFRFMAVECGRLGLPMHLHSCAGAGGYFNVAGGNPMLLEPLFNDPALRKTTFVMVHGGWPFEHQLTALLTKPNVYLDFSQQSFTNYPRAVSEAIRAWLEYVPEKVLFATDAYPFAPPDVGWEEAGWVANSTGREALALALTGMLRDSEITRDRALELARMVLRDNARKLYQLK